MIWESPWGLELLGRLGSWVGGGWAGSECRLLSRMELQDFLRHFNTVQICSLSPEVLGPSPAGGGWHVHIFHGRWVRGFNSGGSQTTSGEAWRGPERQGRGPVAGEITPCFSSARDLLDQPPVPADTAGA